MGAIWGALGVCSLIGFAIFRLLPKADYAVSHGLTTGQWLFTLGFALFMAYTEGYRGFQQKFSPRTAARVRHIRENPTAIRILLAPLFAMGYFDATKRTKIVAYAITLTVTALVIVIQYLAQPWRGIIDIGVIVGLSWGLITLMISIAAALTQDRYEVSPEVG